MQGSGLASVLEAPVLQVTVYPGSRELAEVSGKEAILDQEFNSQHAKQQHIGQPQTKVIFIFVETTHSYPLLSTTAI